MSVRICVDILEKSLQRPSPYIWGGGFIKQCSCLSIRLCVPFSDLASFVRWRCARFAASNTFDRWHHGRLPVKMHYQRARRIVSRRDIILALCSTCRAIDRTTRWLIGRSYNKLIKRYSLTTNEAFSAELRRTNTREKPHYGI